jgi:hypothetical protein
MSQFDHDPDPDFSVRHEAGQELKRIVRHPVEEAARLEKEAEAGQSGATPGIVVFGVGLGVTVIAILMFALILLVVWIAVR